MIKIVLRYYTYLYFFQHDRLEIIFPSGTLKLSMGLLAKKKKLTGFGQNKLW